MLNRIDPRCVTLNDGELLYRERENKRYLMSLSNEDLLLNYELEAGRVSIPELPQSILGGWESPTCQLRGHFLGHWLSAAAMQYAATKDEELKAKADAILAELALCQRVNGGEWLAPIPEKYLTLLSQGRQIWAPQYTLHKLLMGLVDQYTLAGSDCALQMADRFADWFDRWSAGFTEEEFDDILDTETGGMLEVWADLLGITGKEKYRRLLRKYERRRLFVPLVKGEDVLSNLHANTTIPEILGCARAYEVTGDAHWLDIVQAYWRCAVEQRGCFATGGQTQGEIWTPLLRLKARLGDKNQEHCTVYNMVRLAEFLFRHSGEDKYQQYIEYNVRNGIMAQTYWHGTAENAHPGKGLLTYFLPMKAGLKKTWAGERDSFFCCHGTMVQANAGLHCGLYYGDGASLTVAQYANSEVDCTLGGQAVHIELSQNEMNGFTQQSSVNNSVQRIAAMQGLPVNRPDFRRYEIRIHCAGVTNFALRLRVPQWVSAPATLRLNGEPIAPVWENGFAVVARCWQPGDMLSIDLPVALRFVPLPDDADMGAFRYGADVLVGLCSAERVLPSDGADPAAALCPDTERQWGTYLTRYRTDTLDPGISFLPVNEVGYQPYQMYFKVRRTQ